MSRFTPIIRLAAISLLFPVGLVLGQTAPLSYTPPPDATWTADASVEPIKKLTDLGLGAIQGVVVRDGKIYAYGDVVFAQPRVGVIREYTKDLVATGKVLWLTKGGKPLIQHPTGLTWNAEWGTWLGDTVKKKAIIYRLDWERAWRDGTLDHAILSTIDDDASINGCRPEFVKVGDRTLIATADYGDIRPEIRLCDPNALLKAGRTSAPGVVVHRILAGAFNQNLHWDAPSGHLTCVQNVVEGRGWRLDVIDLALATKDGRVTGEGARVKTLTFDSHDELEGYCPLDADRALIAVARRADNLILGKIQPTSPRPSPPAMP